MKRTCCYCGRVFDDRKRRPAHWPEIPADKNHGICKGCGPRADKELADYFASKKKT